MLLCLNQISLQFSYKIHVFIIFFSPVCWHLHYTVMRFTQNTTIIKLLQFISTLLLLIFNRQRDRCPSLWGHNTYPDWINCECWRTEQFFPYMGTRLLLREIGCLLYCTVLSQLRKGQNLPSCLPIQFAVFASQPLRLRNRLMRLQLLNTEAKRGYLIWSKNKMAVFTLVHFKIYLS